jgi:2-polyprenyl-6-methoxyphenol hydroxylase-like FAD-dependent oxidoreductase
MSHPDLLVIGGGPCGMMAGLLFARAGCSVRVIEKHDDFLHDFRGDTVHPSTMEVLDQIGLLDAFLERPHQKVSRAELRIGGREMVVGDMSRVKSRTPFVAMMPQWEFLDFLRQEAERYPGFRLDMGVGASELIEEDGRVCGARLTNGEEVRSGLVIAADGRWSIVRRHQLLPLKDLGSSIDVFWFELPKREPRPEPSASPSRAGASSSGSTAATIGNAPLSFARAARRISRRRDRGLPQGTRSHRAAPRLP